MKIEIEDVGSAYSIFKISLGNKRRSGLYFCHGINTGFGVLLTKDREKAFRSSFNNRRIIFENIRFNLMMDGYYII